MVLSTHSCTDTTVSASPSFSKSLQYAGRSPFWLPRKPRKFIRDNILNGSFAFPTAVPEEVKPLIHGLLKVNENVR
jgi:hypothetical protein